MKNHQLPPHWPHWGIVAVVVPVAVVVVGQFQAEGHVPVIKHWEWYALYA